MNTNEIALKITADIKGIKSSLNQVQKDLKKFGSETTDSTQGLNNALQQTEQQLNTISAKSKNFAQPAIAQFDNLRKGAGAANGSVIAFGRIIQDAPFGILGVANNIQSFSEQFASLGNQAQSTGGKLKLFFSALITPTNLAVLAVSALTAAWQAYNLGIFDSFFATESLNDQLKELNESTKSATANAGVELVKLQNLKSVIEDETISRDKRLLAVNQLIDTYPKIFSLADREKLLNGQLVTSYEILTKAIVAKAKASIAEQELPELIKQKEIVDLQLKARQDLLAVEEASLKTASRLTSITQAFEGSEYEQVGRRVNTLKKEVQDLTLKQGELKINIEGYTESIVSYANEYENFIGESTKSLNDAEKQVEFYDEAWNLNEQRLSRIYKLLQAIKDETPDTGVIPKGFKPEEENADVVPKGKIEALEEELAIFEKLKRLTLDTGKIAEYNVQIANLKKELQGLNGIKDQTSESVNQIIDAFSSLGAGIGASLNISNRALRGFVTTLLSSTPKIIGAIIAKSQATRAAAEAENAANLKLATGNVIVSSTEAAKALGPVGLAVLPVLIAGAVALISSAFSGGGGGGSTSGGQGSTFTNRREFGGPVSKGRAYIVGEKRPELFVPNTNGIIIPQLPSMDYSGARVSSSMYGVEVMLKGPDDLLFFVEQAQIRRGIR